MATIVYQGLPSCLESQLDEPRALRLRLSSSKPHLSELTLKSCFVDSDSDSFKFQDHKSQNNEEINNKTSWSFLYAISNTISNEKTNKESEPEPVYVHPLEKRFSTTLTQRSLELCTENLGSENGTEILEDSIFSLSTSDIKKSGNSATRKQGARKVKAIARSFPPPLTTIRGSESIKVRHHRQNGRLVIEAVKTPAMQTCFRSDRSNGRLRLSFWNDDVSTSDENEITDEHFEREGCGNGGKCEIEEEEEKGREEGGEEEENDGNLGEDMGGNSLNVVGKIGKKRFGRSRSCKEGLLNWEAFWVTTTS